MSVRDTKSAISRLRGGLGPHLSGAAERLVVAGNERRHNPADRREGRIAFAFAFVLLAVVVALPVVFDAPGPSVTVTLALVAAVTLLSRVEFDVGAGYTYPLQLVFVPALFVVHPAWAPGIVAVGLVLGRLPDVVRHRNPRRLLVAFGWISACHRTCSCA